MNKKVIVIILLVVLIIGVIVLILNNKNTNNNSAFENSRLEQGAITQHVEVGQYEQRNNINNTIIDEKQEEQKKVNEGDKEMPVLNKKIGNKNFTATLYDNETTRELIKQMPLTINMSDLHGNEKYYYFNQSLLTNSKKVGNIKNGDLMLYGSDRFVLFYESFRASYSYTKIGKIANPSGLTNAVGSGNVEVMFSID